MKQSAVRQAMQLQCFKLYVAASNIARLSLTFRLRSVMIQVCIMEMQLLSDASLLTPMAAEELPLLLRVVPS